MANLLGRALAITALAAACGEVVSQAPGDAAGECAAPETACGEVCVDTDTDVEHCGSCAPCALENATATCAGGACAIAACEPNFCDLDGAGGCETAVDLASDPNHCGACGKACTSGVCESGVCGRRAFATDGPHNAALGGLTGADAICQGEADTEALGGVWKAWLADDTGSPALRFSADGFFVRFDGVRIADSLADLLDGTIDNALNVSSKGIAITASPQFAWSNVEVGGVAASSAHCGNWTSTSSGQAGGRGQINLSSTSWSTGGTQNCSPNTTPPARLYCFEQ